MERVITGGCCCGSVSFSVKDDFSRFYLCHCEQCRKLTGSAHASNLFTTPDKLTWIRGKDKTKRYDHPERAFSKVFCTECGSGLPFETKNGQWLLVPAGCLDEEPTKLPDAQIFCAEQTHWHKAGMSVIKLPGFPK